MNGASWPLQELLQREHCDHGVQRAAASMMRLLVERPCYLVEAIRGQGMLHKIEVEHHHNSTPRTATFCLVLPTTVCRSIQGLHQGWVH